MPWLAMAALRILAGLAVTLIIFSPAIFGVSVSDRFVLLIVIAICLHAETRPHR